jgi:Cof subfamily protein (haloacid dehalogenase superfamily)
VSAPPELLALDVDGTLLTSEHEITREVDAAVRRVRGLSVEVVLTTSRPPRALWPILSQLGLVGPASFVASQGALTGSYSAAGLLRVLDRRPMPAEPARRAVAAGRRLGLTASWFAGERWLVPEVDELIRQEARIVGCAPTVADLALEVEGPDKLLLLSAAGRSDLPGCLDLPPGLVAEASTPTHVEITAAGVDKATALAEFCARRGIRPSRVAAVGDGLNDRGMLRFAGTAVAPANAHPRVLELADLVAPSNDAGAVAWVVERLFGASGAERSREWG